MKQKKFLSNFSKSLMITLLIGIILLSIMIIIMQYIRKYNNISKNHHNQIDEINDQIEWIKYDKFYIKTNSYHASFIIKTKNIQSAESMQQIIEHSNILKNNNFTVQLQNDPVNNRKNLLSITFTSNAQYNVEFQNIVNKLLNSEYIDKKYQKLSQAGTKLLFKQLNTEELTKKESTLLKNFNQYQSPQDSLHAQLHKRIKFNNFAKFLSICELNQKPNKNLDDHEKSVEEKQSNVNFSTTS